MKYLFGSLLVLISLGLFAQDEKEFARPDLPGELMVDLGFNVWSSMPGLLEKDLWPSKSAGIYYSKRKELNNKFSFYYGIGLGLEKIGIGDSTTLISNDSVTVVDIPAGLNYDKNKLAITYLDIPLEIRFHPKGTEEGEGFFIGAGAIVGLRMTSHTKWKYEEEGETVKQKISGKYNLNSIRYGAQVRFGFKGVHLFYKKYFSPVFKDSYEGSNPTMTTFGINFTGF